MTHHRQALTPIEERRIVELLKSDDGPTCEEITERFHLSRPRLSQIARQHGIIIRKRHDPPLLPERSSA